MTEGYDVHIRRNSDGLVRVYHYDMPWEEHCHYMWLDGGNYSCDCNRSLFFNRAAGEAEDWGRDCGEVAYTILKFVLPNGEELPGDEE